MRMVSCGRNWDSASPTGPCGKMQVNMAPGGYDFHNVALQTEEPLPEVWFWGDAGTSNHTAIYQVCHKNFSEAFLWSCECRESTQCRCVRLKDLGLSERPVTLSRGGLCAVCHTDSTSFSGLWSSTCFQYCVVLGVSMPGMEGQQGS